MSKLREMVKRIIKEETSSSELKKYIPQIVEILKEEGYDDLSDLLNSNIDKLWKIKKYHKSIIDILNETGYDDLAQTFTDISKGIIKYN